MKETPPWEKDAPEIVYCEPSIGPFDYELRQLPPEHFWKHIGGFHEDVKKIQCCVCKGESQDDRFQTIVLSTSTGSTQWFVCSPDCARAWHIHQATWITLRIATSRVRMAPINNPLVVDEEDQEVH